MLSDTYGTIVTEAYSLSIVDEAAKKWRVRVSTGVRLPSGGYKVESKQFRAASRRQAKTIAEDFAEHVHGTSTKGTFAGLVEQWWLLGDWKPSTRRGYESKMRHHILPELGHIKVVDLDRQTMTRWFDGVRRKGLADKTVNQCVGIVQSLIRWAYRRGLVLTDDCLAPLETTERNTVKRPDPTSDQVGQLLRFLRAKDVELFPLVLTATTTGLRRGELLGLQWGDMNWLPPFPSLRVERSLDRQAGLVEPKTARSKRTIGLDDLTLQTLAVHRTNVLARLASNGVELFEAPADGFVFPSPRDPARPWYPEALSKRLGKRVVEAGLPKGAIWLHGLRHHATTELADAGVPLEAVANRLGHDDVGTTRGTYMGRLTESDRAMATLLGDRTQRMLEG